MQVRRRPVLNACAYLLLVAGSLVFSFPFLWMVCSSIKVDRELFPERFQLFPGAPHAEPISPFLDRAYYRYAVSEQLEPHLPLLERLTAEAGFEFPSDVDRAEAIRQTARGLARKLETSLPAAVWEKDSAALVEELRRAVTPALVGELFDRVYRWIGLGALRVHSQGLAKQELGAGVPMSKRFHVVTPTTLWLEDRVDRETPAACAHTDFSLGNAYWRIEQTFDLVFDATEFYRLQLYMRPDDNWHRLYCTVEMNGALYRAAMPVYPANFEWITCTWQLPGPDDKSNKIKTWTLLNEVDRGPQYESHPRKIKVAFELRQSSLWQAWWGKISRNYILTMQHIPVWRYTATSFYLVILNIVLSVFSCSMVAYAIARLQWPGRDFCFILMLATMMVPGQVTMIPSFLIWKELGFYNTLVPLWLGAAFASPFSVFLLRQFLKGIPRDLEDAARIDGCGYHQIYWHIMLPLVKPTLAVIAIGAFMGAWNNFMGPLIFIADQRLYPLAFGLYAFAVQVGNNPALTMAGSFLMTVPIIVVFFFAQRYFIEGVTLTGIKG